MGNLDKPVCKAPRQFTRLRELSRIHMTLVTDVVRAQSRIKSLYRSRGVRVSGVNVYGVRQREEWQKQLSASVQTRATRLYECLDFLLEQKKQAEADLVREAKKHPIARILQTAPGFGPIRAARLVPIVVLAACRLLPSSLPNEATVLELLRAWDRDSLELGLDPDGRWRLGQGSGPADARSLSPAQSLLEGHLQGGCDDGDHAAHQGSHLCTLPAASRWGHQTDAREAEPGAHDRSDGAAHVEGRGGVRPRTSRSVHRDPRRLGDGSIGRVDDEAAFQSRNREESSYATPGVAAEVSIPVFPGRRLTARRSNG